MVYICTNNSAIYYFFMTKQENKNINLNREFNESYHNLPYEIVFQVKDDLLKDTGWSISTLYSRLCGRRALRHIEIPVIKRVFEKYGVEIFK